MNSPTQRDPELQFPLFVNDKGGNPARPDYTGKIQVGGVVYRLSGWLKDGRSGQFIAGNAQIPTPKGQQSAPQAKTAGFPRPAGATPAPKAQPEPNLDKDVPY
jgi:hypothetical protein